jgi:hypothetical protein
MEKAQDLPEICINQNNTPSPPEPSKDIAPFPWMVDEAWGRARFEEV